MAYKTIQRPRLSLIDRFYIRATIGGMLITLKHTFLSLIGRTRGKDMVGGSGVGITMQFPEHRWDKNLPAWYRGKPTLVRGDDGRERCVSCQLCEFICPARAITVIPGEIPADSPNAKIEKAPKEFYIDMLRCIYCGMCQEVCPEQAIFLNQDYLLTLTDRTKGVNNKAKLYEMGGTKKGLVNKWNQYK